MFAPSEWNASYLLGNDSVRGWGTRYFFTFYSEFGERHGAAGVEVAILTTVFITSLIANLSIAAAVLRYPEMRTVTNCFLLNLTVADCLFVMGIPAVALARVSPQWRLGDLVCRLLPYSQFVCGFVLLWTLTLISMDRHRCIVVPPYRSQLTPRLATLLTVATWALAAVLFLPVAFWFDEHPSLQICTLVFPRYDGINLSLCFTIPVIFFSCILPMALLVYHYQRIFDKLLKTRKRWASSNSHSVNDGKGKVEACRKISLQQIVYPARHASLTHHDEQRLKKHIRVVTVLLLNVLLVLNMWLPITVVMFLIYVDGRRPTEDTGFFLRSHHFIWALLVAYLNTLVNPLLSGIFSENFRACFSRFLFGSKTRKFTCKSALTQDASRVQRSSQQLEGTQGHTDRRHRLCYHLSCSDNTNDRLKPTAHCSRHYHSYPGSTVTIADAPSTATILK